MYSSPDSHSNTRMEGKRERREVRTKKNGKNKRREGEGQTTNRKNEKENSQGKTGEGGLEREEAENRKHSVCKSQIKSISVLHTKPCPGGYMGFSASYSEQVGQVRQPLLTFQEQMRI